MILIAVLCAMGIAFAFPNLLNEEQTEALPSWLPNQKLSLGLDLQGGSHLLFEVDVRGLLVYPDTETLEFRFDDPLVSEGLVDVQNYKDQMAGFCHCNDLTTSTFAVFGALNDTRQIQHLNLCTVIHDLIGHSRELGLVVSKDIS